MNTAGPGAMILTVASCSFVREEHRSNVVVSGSYGGRYNAFNAAKWGVRGVIMSDAGGGMDGSGIARLADLDNKGIIAGTTSADSAPIGDSRALYHDGILSHVNQAAVRSGGLVGMALKDFVDVLITAAKQRA